MATKHTPGPWNLTRFPSNNDNSPAFFRIDAKTTLFLDLYECADGFVEGENEANAHLIAAAPELLAACQVFIAYDESNCTDDLHSWANLKDMMVNAIAKATTKPE